MLNTRPAKTEQPILDVIANRYANMAFEEREVEKDKIASLLEAARWAPSSYNEQPWQYVIGYKGDEAHAKLAECLMEGNAYARVAPVLMLSVAKKFYAFNKSANRHAMHDVGCATGYMYLQATSMDLGMHEMGGFSVEKARELFAIGDDFEPAAVIAIGYPGDVASLPDGVRERAMAPRSRKATAEMIWA